MCLCVLYCQLTCSLNSSSLVFLFSTCSGENSFLQPDGVLWFRPRQTVLQWWTMNPKQRLNQDEFHHICLLWTLVSDRQMLKTESTFLTRNSNDIIFSTTAAQINSAEPVNHDLTQREFPQRCYDMVMFWSHRVPPSLL